MLQCKYKNAEEGDTVPEHPLTGEEEIFADAVPFLLAFSQR